MEARSGTAPLNASPFAVSLRPVRPADPSAVEALYRACTAVEPGIGPVTAADWSRTVALPQFRGGRDFLVAERDGHLVGLAESSPRGDDARRVRHLKLVVDPAHRRLGVATALLRAVLEQDAGDGPMTVQADVPAGWAAGLAFLARYGFAQVESEVAMRAEAPLPTVAEPAGVALVRPAIADGHADRLAAIHNAAFRDDAGFASHTPADALRHAAGGTLWLAVVAGEVVGYALVESDPDLGWLEVVAVDPAHRGRGIGAALVARALLADGVGPGRAAGLTVSSRNGAALRLYGRLGFQRRAETGTYAARRADLLARLLPPP